MTKLLTVVAVASIIILAIMLVKYKTVYKVSISGQEVGYVLNKSEFEKLIEEKIIKAQSNIAYVDIEEPTYELMLTSSACDTNEQEIFDIINQSAVTTYKVYEIAVNGANVVYVNSIEEAEETVNEIKQENENNLDNININVNEIYTQDINAVNQVVEVATAIDTTDAKITEVINEQAKIKAATLDGVYFSVKPVSGNITSRYGAVESVRDHTHAGLDIAAPYGTTIVAAADGEITYSGWMSGYGNLIIIDHGNGIQTYYGHCSKLYAKVGDEVKAGNTIAAVGSTGNSTGNHLHFEIRKNGTTLNPQKYLYK